MEETQGMTKWGDAISMGSMDTTWMSSAEEAFWNPQGPMMVTSGWTL